eukprot:g32500.t1
MQPVYLLKHECFLQHHLSLTLNLGPCVSPWCGFLRPFPRLRCLWQEQLRRKCWGASSTAGRTALAMRLFAVQKLN